MFQGLENLFSPHGASAGSHETQSFIPQDVTVNNYYDERPSHADDDRPDRTGDPDPAQDEFVSDDDADGDDADFI